MQSAGAQTKVLPDESGKFFAGYGSSAPVAKPAEPPKWVEQESQVQGLPGWLDETLVVNSNSPEILSGNGIVVSTFPPEGKKSAVAHLNLGLKGDFDVFSHHVVRLGRDSRTMYVGLLLQNPGTKPVEVSLNQAASFLEYKEAQFRPLPDSVENPEGRIFAGAGDRVTDLILRGFSQIGWPSKLTLAPGEYRMVYVLPIPVGSPRPLSNTRCTLIKAHSSDNVYAACLAMKARGDGKGHERPPTLDEWRDLLVNGSLATPRDRAPTKPKSTQEVIYGRVAGVSRGSTWHSLICKDLNGRVRLEIPRAGMAYSYVFSTVEQGAFGTMNYQSAPLVVRYPDTAHEAHGNYGVRYELSLPLYNQFTDRQRVTVTIQSPYKSNCPNQALSFREPAMKRVFYRGTVRVRYRDDSGVERLRYVHIVLHQADAGKPLVTLDLGPSETRTVVIDFLYPPDSTPPQILTVKTLP
jgi:hypothetical protein